VKKQDLLYIPFYIIISILFLFCIEYLYLEEYETFKSSFYERPFDICRVITKHTYKDIYYGGFTNYLGSLGMAFLIGLACFAFSFPGTYFIDKFFLKRYFFKYLENENSNQINNKKRILDKFFPFVFIIPIPPIIYDFLPFIFYKSDTYNCLAIIKYVESFW